jgi:DNA-binding NtrC family response regulator
MSWKRTPVQKILLAKLTGPLSEKSTQQLSRIGVMTVPSQLETDIRDAFETRSAKFANISLPPELAVRTLTDIHQQDPHLIIMMIIGGENSGDCSALPVASTASDDATSPSTNERTETVLPGIGVTRTDCSGRDLTGGENMIGSSATIAHVRTFVANVARTECNVLLTGETGTGKELVADLIHKNGSRMGKPFVKVNCAAIPDSLLESELFGYERGAFTGAYARTQGKLEQANTGTILFDEIGDMSPYAQAKVLRSIESGEITRLGGRTPTKLDVRILAATNRDLESMAMQDQFRKDLYFRLNVARVHLPPLRDRKSDIPEIADHYLDHFNSAFGAEVTGLAQDTLEGFFTHDWPGNVRELRNLLEGVFVVRRSSQITAADLPDWFSERLKNKHSVMQESSKILSVLLATNWNKSKAASQLHWSRMTLYRKLAKYNLHHISN